MIAPQDLGARVHVLALTVKAVKAFTRINMIVCENCADDIADELGVACGIVILRKIVTVSERGQQLKYADHIADELGVACDIIIVRKMLTERNSGHQLNC